MNNHDISLAVFGKFRLAVDDNFYCSCSVGKIEVFNRGKGLL